jgi:hypothetical protein
VCTRDPAGIGGPAYGDGVGGRDPAGIGGPAYGDGVGGRDDGVGVGGPA